MLVCSRRLSESIMIGDDIEVVVLGVHDGRAKLGIIAAGIALVLWSLEILTGRKLSRLSGVVGVVVGAGLALGVLSGIFRLNVPGIIIATSLEALWMGLVAMQLLRVGSAG